MRSEIEMFDSFHLSDTTVQDAVRRRDHKRSLRLTYILVLSGLLQDAEVVADLVEGSDAAVDLLVGVSGRELYADARLVLKIGRAHV